MLPRHGSADGAQLLHVRHELHELVVLRPRRRLPGGQPCSETSGVSNMPRVDAAFLHNHAKHPEHKPSCVTSAGIDIAAWRATLSVQALKSRIQGGSLRGEGALPAAPGRAAAELLPVVAAASCRRAAGSGASPKPAAMGGAAFRAGIRPCPARCCPASRLTRTEAGTYSTVYITCFDVSRVREVREAGEGTPCRRLWGSASCTHEARAEVAHCAAFWSVECRCGFAFGSKLWGTMKVRLRSFAAGRRGAIMACPPMLNLDLELKLDQGGMAHHGGEAAVLCCRQARRHRRLPADAGALVLPGLGALLPPCSSTQVSKMRVRSCSIVSHQGRRQCPADSISRCQKERRSVRSIGLTAACNAVRWLNMAVQG